MNFLYFAEADVQTGGESNPEAILVPASGFLHADPISDETGTFYFKSVDGIETAREAVTLTYSTTADGGGFKRVCNAFCAAANAGGTGFVVVADREVTAGSPAQGAKEAEVSELFAGLGVTTVAIA